MSLKTVLALAPLLLLSGCFFLFIPGSVTRSVGDAFTGAEGAHCVSKTTKVGDTFSRAEGGRWTVKSLSGTSSGCKDPARPVRALLIAS